MIINIKFNVKTRRKKVLQGGIKGEKTNKMTFFLKRENDLYHMIYRTGKSKVNKSKSISKLRYLVRNLK